MSEIFQSQIFIWFSQFAFQPDKVYLGIFTMMILSAFGVPLPEEVTLLSVGFLVFMGSRPDLYPPPFSADHAVRVVNVHEAAWFCFLAVVCSDTLIYGLGRFFGNKIVNHPRLHKYFHGESAHKVEKWSSQYGPLAVFIFRFTPGIRFPGHLFCGMLKLKIWKFMGVDALAALISVPTQVYLMAFYGEEILTMLHRFKIGILILIVLAVAYVFFKRRQKTENIAA